MVGKLKEINNNNNKLMNENIDLTKILKNCPNGTELYSLVHGEVEFQRSNYSFTYPILVRLENGIVESFTSNGKLFENYNGECILFPSRNQRDWSKFTAPWYKKDKFNPKTLKPFDKVLARDYLHGKWTCGFFSHIVIFDDICKYNVGEILYTMCIPYNDDTKHLVGTTKEAPKYYRYWEN